MAARRALAAAGALLFVAGGLVGWFRDLELDRSIPAHHLVSVGAGAWLAALPLLLAPLAPFERRWLRWLWLAAAGLVLVVGVAGTTAQGATMPFPYFEQADDRQVGLGMSLAGSLVALLALLDAWQRAPEREPRAPWRRPALALLAVGALAAAVALGLQERSREAVEDRLEAQIRQRLAACNRPKGEPVPEVDVRCRQTPRGWSCAQRIDWADGRQVTEDAPSDAASATAAGC